MWLHIPPLVRTPAGARQPKTGEDIMSNSASPFLQVANFALAGTPLVAVVIAYLSSFAH
jgi:hypothetical protein